MTESRLALIAMVFEWDAAAVRLGKPAEVRRGLWRIIDALHGDLAVFRTPGFMDKVRVVLAGMKQTEGVEAIRRELGI